MAKLFKVWIFLDVISLRNQNIRQTLFYIELVSLQCFDYRRI